MSENPQLLAIKGVIFDLPRDQQDVIMAFAAELKAKIEANPILGMTLALVGASFE